MDIQKRAMLEALEKNLGIVTGACMAVGIARSTHYLWMTNDPEYKTAVEEIDNLTLDFAESRLHNKIRDGDTTATIFFLKTKGKKRGYIERVEQEVTGTMDNHLQISIVRTEHRIKKAENEIDLE